MDQIKFLFTNPHFLHFVTRHWALSENNRKQKNSVGDKNQLEKLLTRLYSLSYFFCLSLLCFVFSYKVWRMEVCKTNICAYQADWTVNKLNKNKLQSEQKDKILSREYEEINRRITIKTETAALCWATYVRLANGISACW